MQDRSRISRNGHTRRVIPALLALLLTQGCLTYSSYQSARIVERGNPHATVGITRSVYPGKEKISQGWWTLDGDMRFGVARRIDALVRLSIIHNLPEGGGMGQFTLGLRAGIIKDHLAMTLPATVTIGDFYFYSLRIQPGFIGTIPLGEHLEINGSARGQVYVYAMELFGIGYNVGLGITSPSGEWTIHPEAGWLQLTGTSSGTTYFQYGVGFEHNFVVEQEGVID